MPRRAARRPSSATRPSGAAPRRVVGEPLRRLAQPPALPMPRSASRPLRAGRDPAPCARHPAGDAAPLRRIGGNPSSTCLTSRRCANRRRARDPALVDATVTRRPRPPPRLGAHLVLHSATISSPATRRDRRRAVDGGRMDWDASGKFPTLPSPRGFHGMVFSESRRVRVPAARAPEGLRDFRRCMAPMTASRCCRAGDPAPACRATPRPRIASWNSSPRTRRHPRAPPGPRLAPRRHALAARSTRRARAPSSLRGRVGREAAASHRRSRSSRTSQHRRRKSLVIHPPPRPAHAGHAALAGAASTPARCACPSPGAPERLLEDLSRAAGLAEMNFIV